MSRDAVSVDLALQGGGSHGAFTWGVLDRLLEEPWLQIDGISGTSAGAMNAAVLADGHATGGADGARAALEAFWRRVSEAAPLQPVPAGAAGRAARPLDARLLARYSSPWISMSRLFSPYDLNPSGTNPLRDILAEVDRFRAAGEIADQALRHGDQRAHGPWPGLPERRVDARRAARLGLPADHVPGDRDRRRGLLGRRLFRQSDAHAAGARMPVRATPSWCRSIRSSARARPARARHPESAERGVVQRRAAEGAADDGAAAPGRRSRQQRGRALGADAHARGPRTPS